MLKRNMKELALLGVQESTQHRWIGTLASAQIESTLRTVH